MARKQEKTDEGFGARLARYRKAAGFSQVTFAEAVGISARMVAYWEAQAPRPPPSDQLGAMAQVLGVRADDLLGLSDPETERQIVNRPLLRYLELLEKLPVRTRKEVLRMLRGLAHEHGIELDESHATTTTKKKKASASFLRVRRGEKKAARKRAAKTRR